MLMTTAVVSGVFTRPTTNCMKPSSTMAGTADKPTMPAMNCGKHANAAGTSTVVGGTKTATAGTRIVTGTPTITTATHSPARPLGNKTAGRCWLRPASCFHLQDDQ